MNDGWLAVDKPTGPSSHQIVAQVRRLLGIKRVGHTGTLDPLASGLLLVLVGRATRLAQYAYASPKVYHGTLALGITTDSDDITGKVLTEAEQPLPSHDQVINSASKFVGLIDQVPPAVSAVKVKGRRLYKEARAGRPKLAAARSVEIHSWTLTPLQEAGRFQFEASVSSGTYIRSLVRDLGTALGCGGCLLSLRRVAIGPMNLEDAWVARDRALAPDAPTERTDSNDSATKRLSVDQNAPLAPTLRPTDSLPLDLPAFTLPEALHTDFNLGKKLSSLTEPPPTTPTDTSKFAVFSPDSKLLGVAEWDGETLHPRVVLHPPSVGTH